MFLNFDLLCRNKNIKRSKITPLDQIFNLYYDN